jgi:segregation and condensation protein B
MLQEIVTLLYLSGEPIKTEQLASFLNAKKEEIEQHANELSASLQGVGLSLLISPDGWSIVTQSSHAALVEKFWKEELQGDLTPATLQVLTLVAYLGSPTREEISYIRGVQSSQSIRTLAVRGLISRQGETCTLTGDALKQLGVTQVSELPDYETINKNLKEKLEARNAA